MRYNVASKLMRRCTNVVCTLGYSIIRWFLDPKLYVKFPRKGQNHAAEPSRGVVMVVGGREGVLGGVGVGMGANEEEINKQ